MPRQQWRRESPDPAQGQGFRHPGVCRGEKGSETNRELIPRQLRERLHLVRCDKLSETREGADESPSASQQRDNCRNCQKLVRKGPSDLE